MKQITFFIASLSCGGAERQLSLLANFLVEKGYKVNIITFSDYSDHYPLDERVGRIRYNIKKGKFLNYINLFFRLIRVKTDCFISFGQRENLFSLFPFCLRMGTKFIACERNFTVGKSSLQEKILLHFLYKRADSIVTNSYSQHEHIKKLKPSLSKKLYTIINYTDVNKFNPLYTCSDNLIKFGIFCRYEPQKNWITFLEACAIVVNKIDTPFVVEAYGRRTFTNDKLREYYNSIEELKSKLLLNNKVIFNDSISNVSDELSNYDAIILPSYFEGFSNSIAEAICAGRPALVSDVSDNSIMVKHGVNGYLFNPYSAESIANAIIQFVKLSEKDKFNMSIQSRNCASSLFKKDIFISSYLNLIEGTNNIVS